MSIRLLTGNPVLGRWQAGLAVAACVLAAACSPSASAEKAAGGAGEERAVRCRRRGGTARGDGPAGMNPIAASAPHSAPAAPTPAAGPATPRARSCGLVLRESYGAGRRGAYGRPGGAVPCGCEAGAGRCPASGGCCKAGGRGAGCCRCQRFKAASAIS